MMLTCYPQSSRCVLIPACSHRMRGWSKFLCFFLGISFSQHHPSYKVKYCCYLLSTWPVWPVSLHSHLLAMTHSSRRLQHLAREVFSFLPLLLLIFLYPPLHPLTNQPDFIFTHHCFTFMSPITAWLVLYRSLLCPVTTYTCLHCLHPS